MKGEIKISYNWERNDGIIPSEHYEALKESALNRAIEMMKEGYREGELHDSIYMNDDDPEDGVEYHGWWKVREFKDTQLINGKIYNISYKPNDVFGYVGPAKLRMASCDDYTDEDGYTYPLHSFQILKKDDPSFNRAILFSDDDVVGEVEEIE
jgi:hypothetical protein